MPGHFPVQLLQSVLYGAVLQKYLETSTGANAGAQAVMWVSGRAHITPLLRKQHWLPVCFQVQFKMLVLTFQDGMDLSLISSACHIRFPEWIYCRFLHLGSYIWLALWGGLVFLRRLNCGIFPLPAENLLKFLGIEKKLMAHIQSINQ